MLEMFFDNEKVFSVIEKMLQEKDVEVNVPRICFNLGISPEDAVLITRNLVFLDVIKETDSLERFILNLESDILLAICVFDTIIGKFCEDKLDSLSENEITINVDEFPSKEIQEFLDSLLGEKFGGHL